MRILIQRVCSANVSIEGKITSEISQGLLIFIGITNEDNEDDIDWLVQKSLNLRIFNDENNVMNKSILDINGEILVVSQFTLMASTKKGNRPSYIRASKGKEAIKIYNLFIHKLEERFNKKVFTGTFGADMKISLINDGPVTIWIDSKNRE